MPTLETREKLAALNLLLLAYPDRAPQADTLQLYLERLSDIPAWLVRQAVERHIDRSAWFPRIADLRDAAARIARTRDFASVSPYPNHPLSVRAVQLEQAYYEQGELNPREWQRLAEALDQAERPHLAARLRQRLAHYLHEMQPAEGGGYLKQ